MQILLVNDDGPPGSESPYIFTFYKHLKQHLPSVDVKVVLPSSQKSWIGGAYHIKEITKGVYFYPREPDGRGEVSERSRPLKDGEIVSTYECVTQFTHIAFDTRRSGSCSMGPYNHFALHCLITELTLEHLQHVQMSPFIIYSLRSSSTWSCVPVHSRSRPHRSPVRSDLRT